MPASSRSRSHRSDPEAIATRRYVSAMATLLAHIKVRPGTEAQFEAITRRLYPATHASEPNMRRYEFWRATEERLYYCSLSFDDFQSFIVHQTSAHHEVESPELGHCIESIRLEWVDPIVGASDLVATEHQVAAADADDLTQRYSRRFAAEVAAWWQPLR
jgi:quinol monooxygenase YgiN